MFDLAQSPEQTVLADALRQLAERAVRPVMNGGGTPAPADLARVWLDLHRMGLTAPVAAEYGGQGSPDSGTQLLIAEEAGFADPGVAYELVSACHAARMIEELGSGAQRAEYLPRFAADPQFSAGVGYFEGFGRSPGELGTRAERVGGQWELSGCKIGVPRPSESDLLLVIAADAGSGDPAAFVVQPAGMTGLDVVRDDTVIGKLGLDAARTGSVRLRAGVLPEATRLSGNGADGLPVHRQIAMLRLAIGGVLLGTARAALSYAVEYAGRREAFGHPIAEYQGVAFPLVEAATEIDAARLQLWRTADTVASAERAETIVTSAAEAVARCQRAGLEATRIGINTLGGHGFVQDHPVEQWYRAAATLAALDFDPLESDSGVF